MLLLCWVDVVYFQIFCSPTPYTLTTQINYNFLPAFVVVFTMILTVHAHTIIITWYSQAVKLSGYTIRLRGQSFGITDWHFTAVPGINKNPAGTGLLYPLNAARHLVFIPTYG